MEPQWKALFDYSEHNCGSLSCLPGAYCAMPGTDRDDATRAQAQAQLTGTYSLPKKAAHSLCHVQVLT